MNDNNVVYLKRRPDSPLSVELYRKLMSSYDDESVQSFNDEADAEEAERVAIRFECAEAAAQEYTSWFWPDGDVPWNILDAWQCYVEMYIVIDEIHDIRGIEWMLLWDMFVRGVLAQRFHDYKKAVHDYGVTGNGYEP